MSDGIRQSDLAAFRTVAMRYQCQILVRGTNEESFRYFDRLDFVAKPGSCKAKCAQLNPRGRTDIAGLVANLDIWKPEEVFHPAKLNSARREWTVFKQMFPTATSEERNSAFATVMDPRSPHYGCVTYNRKVIHGDYDLYDVIFDNQQRYGNERLASHTNLAIVSRREREQGEQLSDAGENGLIDFRAPGLLEIRSELNRELKKELVMHGAQAQYIGKSNDEPLFAFFANGGHCVIPESEVKLHYSRLGRRRLYETVVQEMSSQQIEEAINRGGNVIRFPTPV